MHVGTCGRLPKEHEFGIPKTNLADERPLPSHAHSEHGVAQLHIDTTDFSMRACGSTASEGEIGSLKFYKLGTSLI